MYFPQSDKGHVTSDFKEPCEDLTALEIPLTSTVARDEFMPGTQQKKKASSSKTWKKAGINLLVSRSFTFRPQRFDILRVCEARARGRF